MKKIFALVTLAFSIVLGVGAGTAQAYPPGGLTISAPGTATAGSTVDVSISGATPGETVTVYFTNAAGDMTAAVTGTADANGNVTVSVTAPADAGTWSLVAKAADGTETIATITITAAGGGNTGNNGATGNTGGGLPNTGSSLGGALGVGLAALFGGAALLFVSRRRRLAVA